MVVRKWSSIVGLWQKPMGTSEQEVSQVTVQKWSSIVGLWQEPIGSWGWGCGWGMEGGGGVCGVRGGGWEVPADSWACLTGWSQRWSSRDDHFRRLSASA